MQRGVEGSCWKHVEGTGTLQYHQTPQARLKARPGDFAYNLESNVQRSSTTCTQIANAVVTSTPTLPMHTKTKAPGPQNHPSPTHPEVQRGMWGTRTPQTTHRSTSRGKKHAHERRKQAGVDSSPQRRAVGVQRGPCHAVGRQWRAMVCGGQALG